MNKKAIIFDFDGVLIDSVNIKSEAFKEIVKNKNETIKKKFIQYHHKNLGISRKIKFKYLLKKLLKKKNINQDIDSLSKKFNKLILNKILKKKLNKGVIRFLEKYKKKYSFFISSGTPQEELNLILKEKKIDSYFDKIYGSPQTKNFHIKKIFKDYKFSKKNLIFVGDGESDFIAALKSNIKFVQIGNNFISKKKNLKIDQFHEIENLILSKIFFN